MRFLCAICRHHSTTAPNDDASIVRCPSSRYVLRAKAYKLFLNAVVPPDVPGVEACLSPLGKNASEVFASSKNRRGGGKEQIYAVQTNLDLNR